MLLMERMNLSRQVPINAPRPPLCLNQWILPRDAMRMRCLWCLTVCYTRGLVAIG